jgi:GT2 family glycosyltransferase
MHGASIFSNFSIFSTLTQHALQMVAWLIALAWLFRLIAAVRGLPTVPNLLDPEYDRSPAGDPSFAVIVPARNEDAGVAACLQSLIDQDIESLQIIGVDDRSTDQTGVIMGSLAATNPTRLTVLNVSELPSGWLGKTHAMSLAANQAVQSHAPDYLLFTDADIVFAPTILRRALAYAIQAEADHLVVMPTAIAKSWGEAMLLSFMQVMGLWAVRPWRVADPKAKRDAIGVGAFNLIRTAAYRQIGGFDAAPMEILEDISLGRRVKQAGLRQRVAVAPGAITFHWAAGAGGILNGMTKNLFALFHFRPELLLGAAVWFALFSVAPVCFLAPSASRIPALLTLAAVAGLYRLSSQTSRISPWYAIAFPVAATLMIYSMLRSMTVTLKDGGVTWRGTFYPLAQLRKKGKSATDQTHEHG